MWKLTLKNFIFPIMCKEYGVPENYPCEDCNTRLCPSDHEYGVVHCLASCTTSCCAIVVSWIQLGGVVSGTVVRFVSEYFFDFRAEANPSDSDTESFVKY